jgi:LemA protein
MDAWSRSPCGASVVRTVVWLLVGLAILAWAVFVFNRLVRLRNQVRSTWADIDVQLKRRHDLVPDLVATVTGYAAHERGARERVTELRTQAVALRSPSRLGEVESALHQALARIIVLQEARRSSRRPPPRASPGTGAARSRILAI